MYEQGADEGQGIESYSEERHNIRYQEWENDLVGLLLKLSSLRTETEAKV